MRVAYLAAAAADWQMALLPIATPRNHVWGHLLLTG
jgi:hypothetical protein